MPLRSAIDLARLPGTILPDLACLPVGARLVSVDGARELLPRMPGLWAHGLQRELVMARLYEGDLALATAEAEDLARHGDPAHPWAGHRTIGYWLARRGEAQEFFKRWKTYGAAHERGDMRRIKELLVHAVAERHGRRVSWEVTTDKRVGPTMRNLCFELWAQRGDVEGLLAFFDGEGADLLPEVDQLLRISDPDPRVGG